MKLVFVTGNDGKYRSFRNIASEIDIDVKRRKIDYPENHDSNSTRKIALEGAEYCSSELGEPVVVTDAGLFIEALEGFPGVSTSFTLSRIGTEGILRLMNGVKDRSAVFRISLAFSDGNTSKAFTNGVSGIITEEERGEGFGFDSVFQLEGEDETFGENPEIRDQEGPLKDIMQDMVEWLENEY